MAHTKHIVTRRIKGGQHRLFLRPLADGEEVGGGALFDDEAVERACWVRVWNIPADFDFQNILGTFRHFGSVNRCVFLSSCDDLPGQVADVEFSDEETAHSVLESSGKEIELDFDRGNQVCGIKKWLEEYKAKRPNPEMLQRQVDMFMTNFDKMEKAKDEPIVDDDGFQLVTYSKKQKRKQTTKSQNIPRGHLKKKQKLLAGGSFYKSQRRERRQKELTVLRQKFQDDKKRIAEMRSQRKFNPF
eukprot:183993_1